MKKSVADEFIEDLNAWKNQDNRVEFLPQSNMHWGVPIVDVYAGENAVPFSNDNSNNEPTRRAPLNPKVIEPDESYPRYVPSGYAGSPPPRDWDEGSEPEEPPRELEEKIDAVYDKLCAIDRENSNRNRGVIAGLSSNTEIISSQLNTLSCEQASMAAAIAALTEKLDTMNSTIGALGELIKNLPGAQ